MVNVTIDDLVIKLVEQAPALVVMTWLIIGLRADVKMLIQAIIELKAQVAEDDGQAKRK